MQSDKPTAGSGSSGPVQSVNRLAPGFSVLPPKLPGKGDRSGSTLTLKFRIIPGWHKDETGIHQNTQLNPDTLWQEDELDDRNRDQLLGDWVYQTRAVFVRHYDRSTKQVSHSWFPCFGYRDVGSEEMERVYNPVYTAAWNWYNGLKGFNVRSKNLNEKYKDNIGEKFKNELKDEYDLSSVLTVLDVGMPTETYFVQVIPLSLGMEKLDYQQDWKQTLLPIDQTRFKKAFINQFTKKRDDPEYLDKPLSPETSSIGTDVVSLENGHAVLLYGQGTVGTFAVDKAYSLNPQDGWMDPETGAWKEWDKVFARHAPGELIDDLISVTSKAAVDWALDGTEFENLIPDRIRGAGRDFHLEPKAKAVEVVNESPDTPEEETPTAPAPANSQSSQKSEQPAASPATPAASATSEEPQVDPAVEAEYNSTLESMQKSMRDSHNTQEEI